MSIHYFKNYFKNYFSKLGIDIYFDNYYDIKNIIHQIKKKSFLSILDNLICPISKQILSEPVITSNGSLYEKTEISRWLLFNNNDPLTKMQISNNLIFIRPLKNVIDIITNLIPELKIDLYKSNYDNYYNHFIDKNYNNLTKYKSFDINIISKDLVIFLHFIRYSRFKIFKYVLNNIHNYDNDYFLFLMCLIKNKKKIRFIINKNNNYNNDYISFSFLSGNINVIKEYVKKNVNINNYDINGVKYFSYIFMISNYKTIDKFIKLKYDYDFFTHNMMTCNNYSNIATILYDNKNINIFQFISLILKTKYSFMTIIYFITNIINQKCFGMLFSIIITLFVFINIV